MVREGRVLISTASDADFGSGYLVTAYEVGAQVSAASASTTVTVRAGHGFASGDRFIVGTDTDRYREVSSVTSTTIVATSAVAVASGEFLVNLGPETSPGPNYLASGAAIYTDMAYQNTAVASTVVTDSAGRYRYFHKGIARWELVRTSVGTPYALYTDTGNPADEDRVSYQIRYAHLFATTGMGTASDPWPGAAIQAAYDDLPVGGVKGKVKMVGGVFDLGSTPLNFDIDGTYTTGFVLEGSGGGNEETGTVGPSYANDGGTMLLYGGTGEAIRVGDFATSGSMWMENSILRGFKVRQTGTAGTGIGILMRLFRWGLIEDVNCVDFSVGLALASVSDFNTFSRVRIRDCQTYGIDVGRTTDAAGNSLGGTAGQCNGNRFINADIMNSARNNGFSAWGIFVHLNCVLGTVCDSEFHNFDTSGYGAVRLDDSTTDSSTWSFDRNYVEGCYAGLYHNNPFGSGTDHRGVSVRDNYFAQIEGYGVWMNSGGAGGITDGVVVTGNTFDVPSSSAPYDAAIGIQLGTYVQNAVVMGNTFSILNVVGTLPGGNIKHGALGTITQNNLVIGTQRQTGSMALDAALAVGTTMSVTGAVTAASSMTVGSTLGVTGVATLATHANVGGNVRRSVSAAVTASTTQTQAGGTALTSDINNVSVCANANDTVTLPTAVAGMRVTILNNGAQTLKIYPASGDNLGAGVDTSTTLASGSNVSYVSYDATNWEVD